MCHDLYYEEEFLRFLTDIVTLLKIFQLFGFK